MCVYMHVPVYVNAVEGINVKLYVVYKFTNNKLWLEFLDNGIFKNNGNQLLEKFIRLINSLSLTWLTLHLFWGELYFLIIVQGNFTK